MRFVAFVGTEGAWPAEAVAEMNNDWPRYAAELERRGGLQIGRELSLPEGDAVTVRVHGGETLVTDGPFATTKEFLAGVELFEAGDLDDAIAREASNPVLRFNPFELRPVTDAFRIEAALTEFGEGNDTSGVPYLLCVLGDRATAGPVERESAASAECVGWRERLARRGAFIMGGPIGSPERAVTLRTREGQLQRTPGSLLEPRVSPVAIEVVRAADRDGAIELAASHPLARTDAIELRSFYTGGGD